MIRHLTMVGARSTFAAASRPMLVSGGLVISSFFPHSAILKTTRSNSSAISPRKPVPMSIPDMTQDQELDYEDDLMHKLTCHTPTNPITGNELIFLVQQVPVVVTTISDNLARKDIISRIAVMLKAYPKNFEVHLKSAFLAISDVQCDTEEVLALVDAITHHTTKLNRKFTDAESWIAISSLRHCSSNDTETLSLVRAVASKLPVENTKVEFSYVDDALKALRGLEFLDSDCVEVQELIEAINLRLRHKKGKPIFFSSFQDAVVGMRLKSSARPEVRELLAHLVDVKYRWDSFLLPMLSAEEDEEESDEEVIAKRSPSRFHLDRLCFSHGQEVVDFIRVLGKKSHRFGQFHAHYKKSGEGIEGFSCYLDVIAYLDLPVHTPQFFQENSALVGSYHEAGHIVASRLLVHSPLEAITAEIGKYGCSTMCRPKVDCNSSDSESIFMDKQAFSLASEYIFFGAISASGGNHDLRLFIEDAKEQISAEGVFVPRQETRPFVFDSWRASLWIMMGEYVEDHWLEDHIVKHIEERFFSVLEVLASKEEMIEEMAGMLLKKKSLTEEDIIGVMEGESGRT